MTIELDDDEFAQLLVMCGYATSAAWDRDRQLALSFVRLANRINKDNPNWTPYDVGQENKA